MLKGGQQMNEKGLKKDKTKEVCLEDVKDPKSIEKMAEFTFIAAMDVKEVFLAGEFNDWNTGSVPLNKKNDKDKKWTVKINLSPGRYEYKFFVDGNWAEDIPDVERVKNPFDTDNFIICVE